MSHNAWYVAVAGQQSGPFSAEQIVNKVRSGAMGRDAHVFADETSGWTELLSTEPFRSMLAADVRGAGASPNAASTKTKSPPSHLRGRVPEMLRAAGRALPILVVIALLSVITFKVYRGGPHDPEQVADEMMPVLLDVAATERARKCSDYVDALKEFRDAKPLEVVSSGEEQCGIKPKGAPGALIAGGFFMIQGADCDKLKEKLPKLAADHENNLDIKVQLYCSKDKRPELDTNDESVRLDAESRRESSLAGVVAHVNEGQVSPRIRACYFQVKAQLISTQKRIKELRCGVLTKDMAVAKVTYDALWSRAKLHDQFDAYKKENEELYESFSKQDKEPEFFDRFTKEMKAKSCSTEDLPSFTAQSAAAAVALATCT